MFLNQVNADTTLIPRIHLGFRTYWLGFALTVWAKSPAACQGGDRLSKQNYHSRILL